MDPDPFDVAIVGGGYAGAVTALEALRLTRRPLRLAVVEPRPALGVGVAYSTTEPRHLLNTRAKRMSLVAGDDSHYTRWASAHAARIGWSGTVDDDVFTPRGWFGAYVGTQLQAALGDPANGTLQHVRDEAVALERRDDGWRVQSREHAPFTARHVVLAVGNQARLAPAAVDAEHDPRVLHAWNAEAADLASDADVLILGTGLTMVDTVLSLRSRGHRGIVHALSRHGALPLAHSESHGRAQPLLSRSLRAVMRELRVGAELDRRSGRPWQWRIDANRHSAQALWLGFSPDEKNRFLRHARTWWDVHRHRVSEDVRAELDDDRDAGKLQIHAGRIGRIEARADGLRIEVHPRGADAFALRVGALINSLGFELDYRNAASPLLQGLLRDGTARPGELGLGLDTDAAGRVRAADERVWPDLHALGTARIGQLWETTAAHEIRQQAAEVAASLVRDAHATTSPSA